MRLREDGVTAATAPKHLASEGVEEVPMLLDLIVKKLNPERQFIGRFPPGEDVNQRHRAPDRCPGLKIDDRSGCTAVSARLPKQCRAAPDDLAAIERCMHHLQVGRWIPQTINR